MKPKNLILIITVLLSIICICASGVANDSDSGVAVRIAVADNVDSVDLSVFGQYTIIDPKTGKQLDSGRRLNPVRIIARNKTIHVGKNHYPYEQIRILTDKDIVFFVNNKPTKRYRDAVDIIANINDKVLAINRVDLERYVRGVLYHEVKHRWPLEVIKAQAVATRTYAIYRTQTYKDKLFDVTSDIYSQVYGGKSAERYRTNIAADRTKGEILMYNGQVLPAYFHANSGGHTEDVSVLWKHDLAPLKGVEDPYSKDLPNYTWKKNFQLSAVQKQLNDAGHKLDLIKEIRILERTPSGRVKDLQIIERNGNKTKISGKDFRQIIGPNHIKSNMYYIEMQGYYFDLIGKGWGHGVGMSQWGAYAMAQQRFSYDEILMHYYPGSQIVVLEK